MRRATVVSRGKMKSVVLHVVDSLDAGGAERVAVDLANAQLKAGCAVHLCTTRRDGPLEKLLDSGVGRLRLARRVRFSLPALWRLASYVRRHHVVVLHAHSSAVFLGVLCRVLCPAAQLVWHIHGGALARSSGRKYRLVAPWIDGVIAVTSELAEWPGIRLGIPEDRVRYIPNGVDLGGSVMQSGAADLPGSRGRRIVCVANFRPEKDHLTLLTAFAGVVREVPDAALLLVGTSVDTGYQDEVCATVQSLNLEGSVFLLGQREDVPRVLLGSDIGVLSSRSEGLPLALLEYGAAGLAAVATRVGECAEVLAQGDAGLLVAPREPQALGEALVTLLRDERQQRALAAALHARVAERYSLERVVGDVHEAYASVLERRGMAAPC